jgi:hypothetical protein
VSRGVGAAVICAMVAGLFAAGCGGSGAAAGSSAKTASSDPGNSGTEAKTATVSLTKEKYIRQSEAICEKADEKQNSELKAYLKKNPKSQSSKAGQEKTIVTIGLPPIEAEVEELKELGPPHGEEAQIGEIIEGIEAAVKKAEEEPGRLLTSSGDPFKQVGELASKYGFKACATPG